MGEYSKYANAMTQTERPSVIFSPPFEEPSNGPRWRTWRPQAFDQISSYLDSVSGPLDSVRSILETGQSVIESIRPIVEFLKMFESLFTSALYTFLNTVIQEVRQLLNDVESTGVYFLDLTSYHWDEYRSKDMDFDLEYYSAELTKDAWWMDEKESITDKYVQKAAAGSNPSILDDFKNEFDGFRFTPNFSTDSYRLDDFGFNINYRQESYNEFIDVVSSAFLNEYDVPASGLISGLAKKAFEDKDKPITAKADNDPEASDTKKSEKKLTFRKPIFEYLRPGRPNFGPDGHLEVHLFTFAFTDIFELMDLIKAFYNLGVDLVKEGTFWSLYNKMSKTSYWKSRFAPDDEADLDLGIFKAYSAGLGNVWGSSRELYKKKPYFYGFTVGSLFSDFFRAAENVLNFLESLDFEINSGLAKLIDDILTAIEEDVQKLIDIIDTIDRIIEVVKAFLDIFGMSYLNIVSDDGVQGVVEQLQNAQGFRQETHENKNYDNMIMLIEAKQNQIDTNYNEQNYIMSQVEKIKRRISAEGVNNAWRPDGFSYDTEVTDNQFPDSYSDKVRNYFRTLWKYESNPNYQTTGEDPGLVELKAIEVQLWDEMSALQQAMALIDPATAEMYKRARIREEIQDMQSQTQGLSDQIARYDTIISNLTTIEEYIISYEKWANGDPEIPGDVGQDLNNKIILRDSYLNPSSAEETLTEEVADLINNGKDVNSDGVNELSIEMLRDYKESIELEYDRYNNGYDADEDGVWEIIPIDEQIQDIQDEIDFIDNQQSDPDTPDVNDYETVRADLVNQKANKEAEKLETNTNYTTEINELDSVLTYLDGLDSTEYQNALDLAKDNPNYETNGLPKGLAQLKNDRNETIVDSIAYNYAQQIYEYETIISNAEDNLADLAEQKYFIRLELDTRRAYVYGEGVDPTYYPYGGGFPGIDDQKNWVHVGVKLNPVFVGGDASESINIGVKIHQTVIGERSNITGDIEHLFLEFTDGVWKYERQFNEIELQEYQLNGLIDKTTILLAEVEEEYAAWKSENLRLQELRAYEIYALTIQIEIQSKTDSLNTLSADRINNYNTLDTEINNIKSDGWDSYLYIQSQFYNANANTSSEKFSYEWDENETRWLEIHKEWDLENPITERGTTITVPRIESSITRFAKEKADIVTRVTIYQQSVANLQSQEELRQQKYQELRQSEIVNGRKRADGWTRDTKMYYGGFLICYGWPQFGGNYFNFGDYLDTFLNDPNNGVVTSVTSFKDKVSGVFSRWFK